ncbi:hypothetical protein [Allobaculum stercoricanis]|uniref:hypothetical protein n=1 Tax=Allobaculum stercoricanis TaxID=174709 RepID=UPI0003701DF1|nr:hypothetical protein [Allobaculum stercoricanis]
MIQDWNSVEKMDDLFADAGLPNDQHQYMIAYSTFPTGAIILGGAGTAMTENVDQGYGGYWVSVHTDHIDLFPLAKLNRQNSIMSPGRMALSTSDPYTLTRDEIKSIKIHAANGISMFSKTITINLNNGRKYVWLVNNNEKSLPFHQNGVEAFKAFAKTI